MDVAVESPPLESKQSDQLRSNSNKGRFILLLLVVIALAALIYVLVAEVAQRFPRLAPGRYIGSVADVFGNTDGPHTLYVERSDHSEEVFFALLRPGWLPQFIRSIVSEDSKLSRGWTHPLVLFGPEGKLKFTGEVERDGEGYRGKVVNLESGRDGEWKLRHLEGDSTAITPQDGEQIKHWVLLMAELRAVESSIKNLHEVITQQKNEAEKLTRVVTEGEMLKVKAGEKFRSVSAERDKLASALKSKQDQANLMAKQFELSQRVTGMGKLVSLARESLEREVRWIESMLRSASSPMAEDFFRLLERGQKIEALKQEILAEQERIAVLERRSGI